MAASYTQRRPMERINTSSSFAPSLSTPLTTETSTPIATASLANRQASSSYGLFQQCVILRDRLRRVPDFAATFMDPGAPFVPSRPDPAEGETDAAGPRPDDPVSQILHCARLGSSLCFLWNALGMAKQLDVNPEGKPPNEKICKHSIMAFILALQSDLPDLYAQSPFTVTDLWQNNTTGHAKAVNTLSLFVDLLEKRGSLIEPAGMPNGQQGATAALDERARVVRELVESERKYVQDLENLQNYQRRLQQEGVIPGDILHGIFYNLDALVDFQRRFLIGIEGHANQPAELQRFGHVFLSMEQGFGEVYEQYCSNYTSASETALVESQHMPRMTDNIDVNFELPTFLIKPIQRICKYPLLLESLVKSTEPTHPRYRELQEGLASSKRVTDKVNEEKRRMENKLAVQELGKRVDDWKGHEIASFGQLLLEDTFMVLKNDSEREYHVYLFERIILCCKEVGVGAGKKGSKSSSMIKKPKSKRDIKLQLKGRIYIANVLSAQPMHRQTGPPQYLLQVIWKGDAAEEHFSIKCRTHEVMSQWQRAINKAVDDNNQSRRNRPSTSNSMSATSAARFRGIHSPHSAFPNTPGSEMSAYTPSIASNSEYAPSIFSINSRSQLYNGTNGHDYFDEDADELVQGEDGIRSGRATPSGRRGPGTQSLPLNPRLDGNGFTRPRAQTEDSTSNVINQWRNQTPANAYPAVPSLPRSSTPSSSASAITRSTTDGSGLQSLRSSASSRGLKTKQSLEWGSAGFTSGDSDERTPISRNASQASLPGQAQTTPTQQPPAMLRSRSASSPHAYQQATMPMAKSLSQQSWNGQERQPPLPAIPPLNIHTKLPNGHSESGHARTNGSKRFSSSSASTDRSSESSSQQSQGQSYTAATSPASLPNSARMYSVGLPAGAGTASAIKVKLSFGEDTFVIAVLSSISYEELTDKVIKKIRRCGDQKRVDDSSLKLRYQDEEGDRILLRDDDDVAMAFDWARASAAPAPASLTLYAVCV